MASKISIALSRGQWDLIVDYVKKDRKKAAIWAAKPGDLVVATEQAQDILYQLEPNIHGLPVHEAAHIGAPIRVVDALARAYPEGLMKKELVMKRLPLHLATIGRNSKNNNKGSSPKSPKITKEKEAAIKMLIKYYPNGILDGDKLERTPLHYALQNGASEEIIQSMIRTKPNVVKAQDKKGFTPLHLACQYGYSAVVIYTMLHYYPNSVMLVTAEKGFTAEYFCKMSHASDKQDVLQLLQHYKSIAEKNYPTAMDPSSVRLLV